MNKAAFLDRDGVINLKAPGDGYVTRWEELYLLPGVTEAISLLSRAEFRVIVITNQRCVAKGLVTAKALDVIHQKMCNELEAHGALIDAIYYCPHEEHPPCRCRKPAPGMLFAAADQHGLDLSASWMIGDSEIDIQTGRNAGCKTARVTATDSNAHTSADTVGRSLLDVVHRILRLETVVSPAHVIDSISVESLNS